MISLAISCGTLGYLSAVLWVWKQNTLNYEKHFEGLLKIKQEHADALKAVGMAHNSWAAQITALEDKVLAHEMMLKGAKR